MKNTLLVVLSALAMLLFFGCTDKNSAKKDGIKVDSQELLQLEEENQNMESLEQNIENDIKELDGLLDEL